MKRRFSKSSFARTFSLTLAAIAVVASADVFLAKAERAANQQEAARFFANGQKLLRKGENAQAVEQFRSALSLDRDNPDDQLALGQALFAAGRLNDARAALETLLEENSFSGPGNLAMARVLVKQDAVNQATFYYHRAIYGEWKENAGSNPVSVRLELAGLLSRQISKAEDLKAQNLRESLLAELLPLEDEAPGDPATRKQLGWWFLAAGSPNRAATVFRMVLHELPGDAEAYAGMGQAEFAEGNYGVARADFQMAVRLRPGDWDSENRLKECERVLELNPRQVGLSAEQETARSRKLLEAVLDDLRQCIGPSPAAPAQDLIAQDLIETAERNLKRPATSAANIEIAERLWQMRKASCGAALTAAEEPLELVLAKLAQ
ncbi:MAG TPA: tetratricopeptide repeat protein [Bryobacteraceae bacterium]